MFILKWLKTHLLKKFFFNTENTSRPIGTAMPPIELGFVYLELSKEIESYYCNFENENRER